MTILDPSARRWDVTPKRRIVTTSHRIAFDPELGARVTAAQAVQSAVYDATLEHLDRHGPVPWIVPAGGADSVLKWLTRERRQHPEWSLALARGAAQQAWMAWSRWDEGQQALAEQWATEFDQEELVRASQAPHPSNIEDPAERARHEPSPRLLRRLTREPTRCQRRGDKGAAVRLAVPCTGVGAKWHVPGVGKVTLHPGDELPSGSDVRSCQLVERTRPGTPVEKRRYRLNMQCGHEVPKGLKQGKHLGLDYGVRHTVTTSDGRYLDRPDTSELEDKGRALLLRAKTRCRRGSRQWNRLHAKARWLRQKAGQRQDRFERDAAAHIVRGARLVAREDLKLPNLVAAATGTGSAPGSGAKRGLNREMHRARLGALDSRIVRRCLKTGTSTVCGHPGNTSITCHRCKHKDPKSRDKETFLCTACGHRNDADINAALNVRDRGRNVFTAWKTNHGRRRPSSGRTAKRGARIGQRAQAVPGTPGPVSRHTGLDPQHNPTTRAEQTPSPVKSGI